MGTDSSPEAPEWSEEGPASSPALPCLCQDQGTHASRAESGCLGLHFDSITYKQNDFEWVTLNVSKP